MSLFSILNGNPVSNVVKTPLLQMLDSKNSPSNMVGTLASVQGDPLLSLIRSPSTTSSGSVMITPAAQWAAAEASDASKSAADLSNETRAALDASKKANGNAPADLSGLSNRALALVALNKGSTFSADEAAHARSALRERDRSTLVATIGTEGLSATSLSAYGNQLLADRASMSAEELQLRERDPSLR